MSKDISTFAAIGPQDLTLAWHIVPSKAEFTNGTKLDNALYFIEETCEIYRGNTCYTGCIIFYENDDNLPAAKSAATSKLYINKETMVAKYTDGARWYTLAGNGSGSSTTPATTLTRLEWDGTEQMLDVYNGDTKSQTVVLDGLGVSLEYDKLTGGLQLLDAKGNKIGAAIKLDMERFVTGGEYDNTTKEVVLYFDGKTGAESKDKVVIPVGDLVDVYTVASTTSVAMTMTNNHITAAVRVSTAAGNALVIKPDGLYVDLPTDISDVMTRLQAVEEAAAAATEAVEEMQTKVATLETEVAGVKNTLNQLTTTGSVVVDGITIVADPDTGVLSVGAIDISKVTSLQTKLDAKLEAELSTALPTADAASDGKVLSEKAVVNALTWKTGM